MKSKNAQTITDAISRTLATSEGTPLKLESYQDMEFYYSIFHNLLKQNDLHRYLSFTDKGPFNADMVIRTIKKLLQKPVIERRNAFWLSELPSVTKKYSNSSHHSTKTTPNKFFKKANEKAVYSNLHDGRKKHKPKYHLGELVRTPDVKKIFSKRYCAKLSYLV